jgi:hypothetical protein
MSVLQDGASDGAVELRIKAIERAVGAAAALNHRYCHAPDLLDLDRVKRTNFIINLAAMM